MPERVRITDVSPRDGLQNEAGIIPTSEKAELVRRLCAACVDEVEVSSFVSPKWVPQLGDAAALFGMLASGKPRGMIYSALAPNETGAAALMKVNRDAADADASLPRVIDKMSLFTAASETFNRRNTNAGIDESFERFRPALVLAARAGLAVRIYVSCAIACPFEGPIAPSAVRVVVEKALRLVADRAVLDAGLEHGGLGGFAQIEIDLGDTIGAADPESTRRLLESVNTSNLWASVPAASLVLHLHDTFGRASSCVRAALEMGVRSFDGSAGGLGGCPYASTPGKRAPGNISTEALVSTVLGAGFRTGVDVDKLREAGDFAREIVARAAAGVNP